MNAKQKNAQLTKLAASVTRSLKRSHDGGWIAEGELVNGTPCLRIRAPRAHVLMTAMSAKNTIPVAWASKKAKSVFARLFREMADELEPKS